MVWSIGILILIFFFKPGAGPVFDLGVYYLTQLVNLLGPVKTISSISGTATSERIITSQPRSGEKIKVETPTTLMGTLEFRNNVSVLLFPNSFKGFDSWNLVSFISKFITNLNK